MVVLRIFLGLVLCQMQMAWASTFQVGPTQVFLSGKTASALLTLRNESAEALRLQVSVFAWDQNPQGEMLLSPTEDIVFFPTLLTLAPGEERKVRVGTLTAIASSEKTYRIFVEELPSMKSGGTEKGGQVRLRTRVGIPIFLQPNHRVLAGRVQETIMRKGRLSFQVKNTGNIHFVPQEIRVKGYQTGGGPIFEQLFKGWYILAGGSRAYELELSRKECARVETLAVEVLVGPTTLRERLNVATDACGE